MGITSGLACALANWQRLAPGRPGYEGQTEALTKALLKADNIMRCWPESLSSPGSGPRGPA